MKSEKSLLKLKKLPAAKSLLWRYFALFALGVIAVIAIVFYGILASSVLTRAKRRVSSVGEDVRFMLADRDTPPGKMMQQITDYALNDGIDVFVFGADGEVLTSDAVFPDDKVRDLFAEASAKLGRWEEGKTAEFNSSASRGKVFSYAACVRVRGVEPCTLLARYPITHIADVVRYMELSVLIIALGAFAIATIISYTLANKLSDPIRDISGTAQQLAKGNYDVQFTSAGYDEIARLSSSLNYMKDEIKKSENFRRELIANVSHDLKTPLTMIKAYASMIKEISGNDPQKRDAHLQVIIDESDRLTGLVNDILSTSKITAGLEQPNKKVFNLTELVYKVINKFEYLQETQGYCFMVDIDANLYTLADEEQIYQVVYNLVSNAVNYTGEDKTVYVSLKREVSEGRLKFAVRDTGKGIAEDELAHIWDRYYRSNDSHLRPVKGTGLGLNIVKAILQKHFFAFGVNTGVGEGSTFFVDFPEAR